MLAVPKLSEGTGKAQADAVLDALKDWKLETVVKAISFDTTAVNTGKNNGACVLLERMLGTSFLHLACRHHILELTLRNVYEQYFGKTTSPEVDLFKRIKKVWPNIKTKPYKSCLRDKAVIAFLQPVKSDILSFVYNELEKFHPRDDNKEFLELVILFFGEVPRENYVIKTPGAMHHARWLSKAIYCLKMYLLRDYLQLTSKEISGLQNVCIYIVRFYVKVWFTADLTLSCPWNDLQFLKHLIAFKSSNETIALAALNKLSNHFWYLSTELIGLAFFDDNVPFDEKRKMVTAINNPKNTSIPIKRIELNINCAKELNVWKNRSLHELVSQNTKDLFNRFDLNYDFLKIDPALWKDNATYLTAKNHLKHLRVVNDVAERGVALISRFNLSLTKNEEQFQYMLQLVQKHIQQVPTSIKSKD